MAGDPAIADRPAQGFAFARRRGSVSLAMSGGKDDKTTTVPGANIRHARLSEALRANLAKRKAQAKARREAQETRGKDRQRPGGERGEP
jgi:hypothetical protein